MTTTITTNAPVIALLDPDGAAKTVHHTAPIIDPDFYENGRAYWITDQATISVGMERLLDMGTVTDDVPTERIDFTDTVERGGWFARTGVTPQDFGIDVDTYGGAHVARDVAAGPLMRHSNEYTLWAYVQGILA